MNSQEKTITIVQTEYERKRIKMTREEARELDKRCVVVWLDDVLASPDRAFSDRTDNELKILAHDALILLKDKEPVSPKIDDAWPSVIRVCGACGTCLFNIGGYKAKYCSECGRPVLWKSRS